jgi:regulator of protease activity HflC (stomatin/prohibitin superfamily)
MNEILAAVALLAPAFFAAGVRRVPAQRVLAVRRLGRVRAVGPGWHWLVPVLDRVGPGIDLMGHHLHVRGPGSKQAELHFQILDPDKTGEQIDQVDAFVAAQAREALGEAGRTPEQLKQELNRRVGRLGLRVIRCSLHAG